MKVCFAILFLICIFAHAAHLPGSCSFGGETLILGQHTRGCLRITCYLEGTISILACPLYQCPVGKEIGYRDVDPSKPYPECCEGPICKEEGS